MTRIFVLCAVALVLGSSWAGATLRAQEDMPRGAAGVIVERVRLPRAPEVDVGDRIATIVRVDLRRYRFRFLSTGHESPRAQPMDEWIREHHLSGAINAGMFLPSGRSVGFMMAQGRIRSDRRPSGYDGLIGFDPALEGAAPLAIGGAGCPLDLDSMRGAYSSVLQGRKMMIDCQGRPQTSWRTNRYSAALMGSDTQGRAVLIHVRTPYRMQALAAMLAGAELGIRGLVYMEGGPEASLMIDAEDQRVREIGSWEDGFNPSDDNRQLWDLPNIVAFEPRR